MKKHLFSLILSVIALVILLVPINSWQKLIVNACLMWLVYVIYLLNGKALKGGQPSYFLVFGSTILFSWWVFSSFLFIGDKFVLPAFWAAHKPAFYLLTTFPVIFVIIAVIDGYRLFKQLLWSAPITEEEPKESVQVEQQKISKFLQKEFEYLAVKDYVVSINLFVRLVKAILLLQYYYYQADNPKKRRFLRQGLEIFIRYSKYSHKLSKDSLNDVLNNPVQQFFLFSHWLTYINFTPILKQTFLSFMRSVHELTEQAGQEDLFVKFVRQLPPRVKKKLAPKLLEEYGLVLIKDFPLSDGFEELKENFL